LAIGVFDGVHLGHRALVAHLARGARTEQALAVAATFDPLPIQVLAPGAPASALSDVRDRVKLLREAGADAVVVFQFDEAFATLSADEFVDRVKGACDVRRIVVGPDFHFGRRAEGDVEKLASEASAMASWSTSCRRSRSMGRSSARPASAICFSPAMSRPRRGSWAARTASVAASCTATNGVARSAFDDQSRAAQGATAPTRWDLRDVGRDGGRPVKAAASLGVRPTFGGGERVLEAFLLDFSGDVYGEEVEVAFVKRLRDEIAFASPAELSAQIARDVEETTRIL